MTRRDPKSSITKSSLHDQVQLLYSIIKYYITIAHMRHFTSIVYITEALFGRHNYGSHIGVSVCIHTVDTFSKGSPSSLSTSIPPGGCVTNRRLYTMILQLSTTTTSA